MTVAVAGSPVSSFEAMAKRDEGVKEEQERAFEPSTFYCSILFSSSLVAI
jgi:hypothetical protein